MGFMNKIFFAIGRSVADRPITTIITSLIFICVGSLGFINLTLEVFMRMLYKCVNFLSLTLNHSGCRKIHVLTSNKIIFKRNSVRSSELTSSSFGLKTIQSKIYLIRDISRWSNLSKAQFRIKLLLTKEWMRSYRNFVTGLYQIRLVSKISSKFYRDVSLRALCNISI